MSEDTFRSELETAFQNKISIFALVKRLASIILFSIYLFGATEACQLLKLPFLLNHFIEHNSSKRTAISFVDFLKLHYSDQHANTDNQHNRLPFKTFDICCIAGHTVIPAFEVALQVPDYYITPVTYEIYQPGDYILNHTGDIFQPPKA